MMNKRHLAILVRGFLLVGICSLAGGWASDEAWADGMVLPYWNEELLESSQVALLEFDETSEMEHLTIMATVYGSVAEFAWVVPVPALPEVSTAEAALFRDLQDMTRPVYRHRGDDWNCGRRDMIATDSAPAAGVVVISDETVGVMRVLVLSADQAPALIDSLTVWGFLHEQNVAAVTPAIAHYVDNAWYFVAMAVDSTAYGSENPGYSYGRTIEPVRFSFSTPAPVYPMRISAVSASGYAPVYLYVKSQHRREFAGAETQYANRISAGELAEIKSLWPAAGEVLAEGDFLTKLYRQYQPSQMTADITLTRHEDDEEYYPLNHSAVSPLTFLMPGSMVSWLVWRLRRKKRRRRSAEI